MRLGTKEAANLIREEVELDRASHMDPAQMHVIRYVRDVCKELGMEPDAENIHHVMSVLRRNGIEAPSGDEYPKYVERKWDRSLHIVHSDEEADAKINEPQPDPESPKPRVHSEPVQDTGLDLTDRVPRVVRPGDKISPPSSPPPHSADTGDNGEDSIEIGEDGDDEVVLADDEPVDNPPDAAPEEPPPTQEAAPAPKPRKRPM